MGRAGTTHFPLQTATWVNLTAGRTQRVTKRQKHVSDPPRSPFGGKIDSSATAAGGADTLSPPDGDPGESDGWDALNELPNNKNMSQIHPGRPLEATFIFRPRRPGVPLLSDASPACDGGCAAVALAAAASPVSLSGVPVGTVPCSSRPSTGFQRVSAATCYLSGFLLDCEIKNSNQVFIHIPL